MFFALIILQFVCSKLIFIEKGLKIQNEVFNYKRTELEGELLWCEDSLFFCHIFHNFTSH